MELRLLMPLEPKGSMFLSVTLLRENVCERDIAIKPFELGNYFDAVG